VALVLDPKCGKRFPGTTRFGHCPVCHETYYGDASIEKHRVGAHGVDRRCELQELHWQDARGYWHFGEKLTEDQKKEIWG
jgi:hypothetical protein